MIYKYANEDHTKLNVFVNGTLRKCYARINEEILEREQITLEDIQPYQTAEEAAALELSQAKAVIDADTAAKMASFEVEALGKVFDFSERSKNNFTGLVTSCNLGIIPAVPWRPKNHRDNINFTLDEAKQISLAIINKLSQIDIDAQTAKKALEE